MIVAVLIAYQAKCPLADQRLDLMLDQVGTATLGKACGKALDKTDGPARRTKKNRAGIRSDGATRKIRFNTTRFHSGKIEPF